MLLKGKTAVVTGAARGIGAAISQELAYQGAKVILVDILEKELHETSTNLVNEGYQAEYYVLNIKNIEEVKDFFNTIKRNSNRVDILINNAAISPKTNRERLMTHHISLEEWNDVFQVNLTGLFLFTKYSLPFMIEENWGRIINISSIAGRTFSRIAGSHYAATKSGMIGFSRTVASEYGKYNITINNIAPGRVESDMARMVTDTTNDDFINLVPIKRSGNAKEVGRLAVYLCGDDASYITGATIDINGGLYMN